VNGVVNSAAPILPGGCPSAQYHNERDFYVPNLRRKIMEHEPGLIGPTDQPDWSKRLGPPSPKRRWLGLRPFTIAVIAVTIINVVAVATVIAMLTAGPSDYQQILTVCHTAVTDQLKSPSTAKFSQEKVGRKSDQYTIAEGVVDAENSFGATVRATYICSTVKTDGKWQVAAADVYAK
jgi:hypothetical protein